MTKYVVIKKEDGRYYHPCRTPQWNIHLEDAELFNNPGEAQREFNKTIANWTSSMEALIVPVEQHWTIDPRDIKTAAHLIWF